MPGGIDDVCLIAPPFRVGTRWVTVPPCGYGGIQWSMVHLIDGLLALGVRVTLLGAPGSVWDNPDVHVPDVAELDDMRLWLKQHRPALIHDFANFSGLHNYTSAAAYCRTWQLTSRPPDDGNTVFVSAAQMRSVGVVNGTVIPLSVNVARYRLAKRKRNYLLFLGRVSAWKGAYEAAALGRFLGVPVVIAGPAWERDYYDRIVADFEDTVTFVGEVGGKARDKLLAEAWALAVLSQPVPGPWGQIWCEPGAAVVAEAAASGTPVIATDNGCLPSLMPGVGVVVSTGGAYVRRDADHVAELPSPPAARDAAARRWDHVANARAYLSVYRRCMDGERWK